MLYLLYPLGNGFEIEVHMTGYMLHPLRQVNFMSVRRKCEEVYRVAPCDDSEDYLSPALLFMGIDYNDIHFNLKPR